MNNISVIDKKKCCGCTACKNICPKNAIDFKEGYETFLEPVIDLNKCIDCGLCKKRCPQLNKIEKNPIEEQEAYAIKNKNKEEKFISSSGGMFIILAKYFIENGGIVFGATFNNDFKVEHIAVDNIEDLKKLQGSKYIQSNLKDIFKEVEKNLKAERDVLFVGTPCQIAGLKSFLKIEYENLLLVDLVCHGVPSQKLFDKYIEWKEKQVGEKIIEFNFRDKSKKGWGHYSSIKTKSKVLYENSNENPYYKCFIKGYTYRECCYNCLYTTKERVGDITIADFWGCEDIYPDFYDKYGVSAVLLNNKKGKNIFENIKKDIDFIKTDIEKIAEENQNLNNPTKKSKIRENVYKNIENKNFEEIIKENLKYKYTFFDRLKKIMPERLKKKLKKALK